ncbi:MAG: acetoacetate--CoA ligase [bacterium]|jgi:acetoacetyl-CoA synthetase|nr:acetoacetate--CoA ligase [bacterium]
MIHASGDLLWQPAPDRVRACRMEAFRRAAEDAAGHPLPDFAALHAWSVTEPAAFWRLVWDTCAVEGEMGDRVLAGADRMPGARWFPAARLNYAENLLRSSGPEPALLAANDRGRRDTWSRDRLRDAVLRLRAGFEAAGLRPGDRVAAVAPNLPETLALMLAVTSLGGVWTSASPDFGAAGVLDRFGQVEPVWLVGVDAYSWKGQWVDCLPRLQEIRAGLPGLRGTLVIPNRAAEEEAVLDLDALPDSVDMRLWLELAPSKSAWARFPFEQPLYILYSSGTTGKPKCLVHGAGGTLLQHLKEHRLHTDLGVADRLFYYTTTGWMMWNWLVSALASEAALVLWDGSPFHPGPAALWDLCDESGITVFGTSAKYLDACAKAGLRPRASHRLTELRAILSTGSPLLPESFDWVYGSVKADQLLASISGGTDIVSCFVLGNPLQGVRRGEIQGPGLGMDVAVVDAQGSGLVGEAGELVCRRPFPSMPTGFWGDEDGSRYRDAYFQRYPGIWHHGDWALHTAAGGFVILGRSDATLNPGGVRIGTAEIYRQVEQVPEVEEALVVGQDWHGDQRVVLFVKLRDGLTLDQALEERIRRRIRDNATPRHVPTRILQVADLPRTRSGKISELAVKQVIHGRPVDNAEALANPAALDFFRGRLKG